MKHRILILLLTLTTSVMTHADIIGHGSCGRDVRWMLTEEGELTIFGTGDMEDYVGAGVAPWLHIDMENPPAIKTAIIRSGVTSIGADAFDFCRDLSSVTIPNTITRIGNTAFRYCASLTCVIIPNSVTSIDYDAFKFCSNLDTLYIPRSVKYIGYDAFYGTKWLAKHTAEFLYINNILYKYQGTASSVKIKNGITAICGGAFGLCKDLTSVEIPNTVKIIGDFAFYQCKSLTSVAIPNSVTYIGKNAFSECANLKSVVLPDSITSIEPYTFWMCKNLETINIPRKVSSIGYKSFSLCLNLGTISIPHSVDSIEVTAFSPCNMKSLYVSWNRPVKPVFTNSYEHDDLWAHANTDSCILYVPKGLSALYKVNKTWGVFKNIVEYDAESFEPYMTVMYDDSVLMEQKATDGDPIEVTMPDRYRRVKFNGEDVTRLVTDGKYVTPPITKNSILTIETDRNSHDINGDGQIDSQDGLGVYEYIRNKH